MAQAAYDQFKRIIPFISVFLLFIDFSIYAQTVQQVKEKTITAFFTKSPVQLDGLLNEKDWGEAAPATGFTQRELKEGEPATEKTEVRVLYDREKIYVGVVCFDSEPDQILHKEQKRDSEMHGDDTFAFVIDTFKDKRSGYYFLTNPNGARFDALITQTDTGQSGSVNTSWNAVWDVSARTTAQGWSAEFVIPFKTLRFPSTTDQNWSINFRREIRHKNEEVLWCSWRRNEGLMEMSSIGTLNGITGIKRSTQADFKPYVLSGLEKRMNEDLDRNVKYGFDIKYPMTSDLTLDLTAFTDFAQVESDREEINLTRFSIRYPEKREFFIEGSEIFNFASNVSSPFYSRKIGISPEREQVPILGGAKLIGKAGSYNMGIINMQTDSKGSNPSSNYSVVRVQKDVLEKSYIGFIATNVTDSRHDSQAYGADFAYSTTRFRGNQNLVFGGYVAENNSPGIRYGKRAGRLYLNYPNDRHDFTLLYHALGMNYNPEVGYVDRNGIRKYEMSYTFYPRPNIPHVKRLEFSPGFYRYMTDPRTKLLTRTLRTTPFGVEFNSGDEFSFSADNTYEYLDESFTIFRDVVVPSGTYTWWTYGFTGETSAKRPVVFELEAETGDFWNGKRTMLQVESTLKTNKYIALNLEGIYNRIRIGARKFATKEVSGRVTVDFTTDLSSRVFVQWNNETDEASANILIHYIPSIGSDIYLVYNHILDEENHYRTLQNTGICKITYLLRF